MFLVKFVLLSVSIQEAKGGVSGSTIKDITLVQKVQDMQNCKFVCVAVGHLK